MKQERWAVRISGRQKLVAAGLAAALVLLSIQAYGVVTGESATATIPLVHQASGTTSPQANNTLTVVGNGQAQIRADRAILSIGVVTQDTAATDAAQSNTAATNAVIAAIEGAGVNASEIQTSSYSVNPQSVYGQGLPVIDGYQVSNELQVTVVAANQGPSALGLKVGQVIYAATTHGANELGGVEFYASQATVQQAQETALRLAVDNASAQAHTLATALGVSITSVVSARTVYNYPTSYLTTPNSATSSQTTPILSPQSLTVDTSVQVVYAIS